MPETSSAPVLIRADSTNAIGCGHVMRCIALAQQLKRQGRQAHFTGMVDNEGLIARLEREGFGFTPVAAPHPDSSDLEQLFALARGEGLRPGDWIVLDGYHLDTAYQSALRREGFKVLLLDDTAHQEAYDVDVLLNQNVTAPDLKYNTNEDATLLLGPEYALLREDFLSMTPPRRNGPVRRILVSMGGSDAKDVTGMVARAMSRLDHKGWKAMIVLGPFYPRRDRLEGMLAESSLDAELLSSVEDMASLMASCDLAVSASGSTSWELSYMRVPSIYCAWADNQIEIGKWLGRRGAAVYLGWADDLADDDFAESLNGLITNRENRIALSATAGEIVDGRGAERAVAAMYP